MREAIALMNFFIGQTRLLYSAFDEGVAPHIVRLLELSKRLQTSGQQGWVKTKDIQFGYSSKKRPKPDVIRGWMQEATNLSLGEVRGTPTRLEFRAFAQSNLKSLDSVSPKLDSIGQNLDLNWTTPKKAEIPTDTRLGDLNNKKLDFLDSTPSPQHSTNFASSASSLTPQEVVDFSGQGEIPSPIKTEDEDTEPDSALDSESNISPTESNIGQLESNFLSTSPINTVDADCNEVPPVEPKSTNDEVGKPTITQGCRVRIIMPGSIRNGYFGTVKAIRQGVYRVLLDDEKLGSLRWFECPIVQSELCRLERI
jgi:hypothetical protein